MINFNAPINRTSLGQVSFYLLKEFFKKTDVSLAIISDGDLSAFKNQEAEQFQKAVNNVRLNFNRELPTVKLWHINGLLDSVGRRPFALTFHETNKLTPYEINILNSLEGVFVTSHYTESVFKKYIDTPVYYVPLGLGEEFKQLKKTEDDCIVFGLRGKLEKRKHTLKILRAWVEEFGGDPRYRLDCSIFNPFYGEEEQSQMIVSACPNGELPFNVNILPFVQTNEIYNRVLNEADIDLTGMSGCEGFNLPLFQSLSLGKQAVVLNAHVHKDYCDQGNSYLVAPSGMIDADDGKFFAKGLDINQGQWFDFDVNDLKEEMHAAARKAKALNYAGLELPKKFNYAVAADKILSIIQ